MSTVRYKDMHQKLMNYAIYMNWSPFLVLSQVEPVPTNDNLLARNNYVSFLYWSDLNIRCVGKTVSQNGNRKSIIKAQLKLQVSTTQHPILGCRNVLKLATPD